MKLNRHDEILKLIVEDFIETAQPVGSEALLTKHQLDCSSATIRNVMANLEEEGLLEKTHTSSGRIPSSYGYSYYLERLNPFSNDTDTLEEELKRHFQITLQNKNKSIEDVMEQSCKVLSEITNLATVVLGPKASNEKLVQLQIVTVSNDTVTAILITDQGHVESKTFILPSETNIENVKKCVSLLDERLKGTPISEIDEKASKIAPILVQKLGREASIVMQAFKEAVLMFAKNRMSSFGTTKLLELPDFKNDKGEIKQILDYFDDSSKIVDSIEKATNHGEYDVNLFEQDENDNNMALISKDLDIPTRKNAKIAVVGPKRMNYKKVIRALEVISDILQDYFKDEGDENGR